MKWYPSYVEIIIFNINLCSLTDITVMMIHKSKKYSKSTDRNPSLNLTSIIFQTTPQSSITTNMMIWWQAVRSVGWTKWQKSLIKYVIKRSTMEKMNPTSQNQLTRWNSASTKTIKHMPTKTKRKIRQIAIAKRKDMRVWQKFIWRNCKNKAIE